MKELKTFKNQEFGRIRTVEESGEILFCGNDVAKALGYKDTAYAIRIHCKRVEKIPTPTSGGIQYMKFITEGDVYRLIVRSKLPSAEKFESWVFDEVLPSIRKTGSYSITKNIPQSFPEALRAYANEVEQRELAEKQRDEAIKTKAWINDKKTATAMNTASQKSKEVNRLKIELDRSKEYASIKAVEKATKNKYKWQLLRNYCTAHELEMKKIFDPNFGAVNTYPEEAWQEVYGIDLTMLFD